MSETALNIVYIYLIIINQISGILFAYDKRAAIKSQRRIPERSLHLLEIIGGAFANIVLIYALHHKNRKPTYWFWTWLIAIVWTAILLKQYSH